MSTIACWIVNSSPLYLDCLEVCVRSFARHNPSIDRVIWAIDGYEDVKARFQGLAWVADRTTDSYAIPNSWHPIALARCKALAEIPAARDTLISLDVDGVFYGSVEPMLENHRASGCPISMNLETDPRFTCLLVHTGFINGAVPMSLFPGQQRWLNRAFLNTGYIIASPSAWTIGQKAVEVFPYVGPTLRFGEQALINAVVHEYNVPFNLIPLTEHCTARDEYLVHPAEPYIEAPLLDGKPVVFRHFAGVNKPTLNRYLPSLLSHWRAQP